MDVDAANLQVAHDVEPLDVAQWQPIPCRQRHGGVSRLLVAGYDAHPTPVDDIFSSLPIWTQMPLDDKGYQQENRVLSTIEVPQRLTAQSVNKRQNGLDIKNDLTAAMYGCHP